MFVISTLRMWRQKDEEFKVIVSISLGYNETLSQKSKKSNCMQMTVK